MSLLGRPVTHLAPSMDSVTVGAEKPQVSLVGVPVAETVVPHACSPLVSKLFARVDVVNVKNAVIGVPANNACPAKGLNQFKFSSPVSRVFMRGKSMLAPVRLVAFRGAKAICAGLSALFANAVVAPPGRKVTSPATELPCALFDAVGVSHESAGAVMTRNFNLGLLAHGATSIEIHEQIIPKYFEDAQRISDMFGHDVRDAYEQTEQQADLLEGIR